MRLWDMLKAENGLPVGRAFPALWGASRQNTVATITGVPPLTFRSGGMALTDYTILGNSYQNGTPTPDDPVEVVSVGEKIENILDPYADGWELESKLDNVGRIFHSSLTIYTDVSPFIEIEPGKKYSVCNRNSGTSWYHCFYDGNKRFISSFPGWGTGDTAQTATAPANAKYLRCSILSINYSPQYRYTRAMVTQTDRIPDFYISYGSYGYKIPITCGGVTQNIYLDEPLRKIGDYADEIDFKTGTVVRRIIKQSISDKSFIAYSQQPTNRTFLYWSNVNIVGYRRLSYCNFFKGAISFVDMGYCEHYILDDNCVVFTAQSAMSLTEFISWLKDKENLAGEMAFVYCVLTDPVVSQITLPTITPTPGNNTFSIGTTLQPSQVSITGHIKPVTS